MAAFLQIMMLAINLVYAAVFYFAWTYYEIGRTFFSFLPQQFIAPGFWQIFGIFVCLSVLKNYSPFSVSAEAKAK